MTNSDIREKRKKVICDLVNDSMYVPMKEKELAMFLQVAKEDREEFKAILQELLAEGSLMLTLKGKYMKENLLTIILQGMEKKFMKMEFVMKDFS